MPSILRIKQRPKHLARTVQRLNHCPTRDASATLGMTFFLSFKQLFRHRNVQQRIALVHHRHVVEADDVAAHW